MPANIYESVKKAIQDVVAPELKTIQGQINTLRAETEGRFSELRVEIKRLDEKIVDVKIDVQNLREEIRNLRDEFRLAIDMHERIAALEAKIGH